MKQKTNSQKELNDRAGLFIPAGLFMGMGVGFFTDQLVGGMFVGLGAGFLLMGLVKIIKF